MKPLMFYMYTVLIVSSPQANDGNVLTHIFLYVSGLTQKLQANVHEI